MARCDDGSGNGTFRNLSTRSSGHIRPHSRWVHGVGRLVGLAGGASNLHFLIYRRNSASRHTVGQQRADGGSARARLDANGDPAKCHIPSGAACDYTPAHQPVP